MTMIGTTWRGLVWVGVMAAGALPVTAAPIVTGPTAVPLAHEPSLQQPAPPAPPAPPARPHPAPDVRGRAREPRGQGERGAWTDAETIVKAFRGGDGITLDVLNMAGDIVVVGGKGREGTLSIVRRTRGAGPNVDALLKAHDVVVTEHGNRVAVRTTGPRTSGGRPMPGRVLTNYEISLPDGTALELKNMQGNVRLRNVAGDVRVEAMAGDVVAEALSRVRMLRSMSGDVMLSRSVIDGDANLQSVSGNVIAEAVKAASLTLGTISGTVQIREALADRTLARTVSGNIEYASMPRKAGRYEFKTHAGDIFVFAPRGGGFEFEASTLKGEVKSDVPTEPGTAGTRQVRGSVGDGSAFFDLTTFAGDIKVIKKQ